MSQQISLSQCHCTTKPLEAVIIGGTLGLVSLSRSGNTWAGAAGIQTWQHLLTQLATGGLVLVCLEL